MFIWQNTAALFAGSHRISRPGGTAPSGFRTIAARPTASALDALAQALDAQDSFCVSPTPLPSEIRTPKGDFLTFSGGTSGVPKVIQRSQASWIASFDVNADRFGFSIADSVAVLGQLGHSLALYGALEALHLGMDAHVLDTQQPTRQCASIKTHNLTVLYATPTQLRLLSAGARGAPLPSVRLILCGGGHLDPQTRNAMASLCPNAALHVFYGSAETSFITISDADTPETSVGKAYPGVTLRLKGGEVWVKSPYLFAGYAQGHSADTRWEDDFLSVGEMGHLDKAGHLWLQGRKTRMISVSDQNVFPEEIESVICALTNIPICAVLGVADPARGNRLVAVVQGAADAALADQIKQKCHARLGPIATPHRILFHPAVPLLGSGKIDLQTLTSWLEHQK